MIQKKWLAALLCLYCLAGGILTFSVLGQKQTPELDMVAVNRIVNYTIRNFEQKDFSKMPDSPYEYSVLDPDGNLVFQTAPSAPGSVNEAIRRHDAVLGASNDRQNFGTVLVSTNYEDFLVQQQKNMARMVLLLFALLLLMAACYMLYLNRVVFAPFQKLQDFARHIAMGNLDAPLPMDKHHAFGAFTESFDIMREQLAEARQKEAEANRSKKELVASLSHDIKTPVTSIKLVSELLLVTEQDPKVRDKIQTIYNKSEQIDRLITDMLHATLEDLGELRVHVSEESSALLEPMIHHTDFYGRVTMKPIPGCLLLIDPLRMEQVIDNLINNAYKYAGTPITIRSEIQDGFLRLEFMDYGNGVPEEELPRLFQKFYRGSNSQTGSKNGSGLGLYIAHYLMNEMKGDIQYYNRPDGFSVELLIRLA